MAVGGAGDDQANDVFLAPAIFPEFDGEPVEQFAVEGDFALDAEIFGGFDEASPEEGLPDAVDLDACGEGMVWLEEPACEAESVWRGVFGWRWEEGGCGEGDFVFWFEIFASLEREGVARFVVAHDHDAGDFLFFDALDGGGELCGLFCVRIVCTDFGPDGVIEQAAEALFELGFLFWGAFGGVDSQEGGEVGGEGLAVIAARVFSLDVDRAGPCGEGEISLLFEEAVGLGFGVLLFEVFDLGVLFWEAEFDEGGCDAHGAGAAAGEAVLGHAIECVEEAIVIAHGEGIVFVVVALGAGEGETEPSGGGGIDAIEEDVEALFFRDGAAFAVEQVIPVECGGDELVVGGVREKVAGELFDGELVEGFVLVEGADHPVAPHPLEGIAVLLEPVAIGVPCGV